MNIKIIILVFMAAFLMVFSQPLYVSADRCDDVMEQARQTLNAAITASKQKAFAQAVELYEEAVELAKSNKGNMIFALWIQICR
jgi:uncharacterized protein YybS (DUF2232 family)